VFYLWYRHLQNSIVVTRTYTSLVVIIKYLNQCVFKYHIWLYIIHPFSTLINNLYSGMHNTLEYNQWHFFLQAVNYMYIVSTTIIRIVVRSRPSTPHDATWAPTIKLIITSNLFSNISKCQFLYRNPSTAWRKKCLWLYSSVLCIPLYKLFIKDEYSLVIQMNIHCLFKTKIHRWFIWIFIDCSYQYSISSKDNPATWLKSSTVTLTL
jgi:hypothetical protein